MDKGLDSKDNMQNDGPNNSIRSRQDVPNCNNVECSNKEVKLDGEKFLDTFQSYKVKKRTRLNSNEYAARYTKLNDMSYRCCFLIEEKEISYLQGLDKLENDSGFQSIFISALKKAPFSGYVWEMPPIISSDNTTSFQFVLTRAEGLTGRKPDTYTFSSHFNANRSQQYATSFRNIGGDAIIISPLPSTESSDISQLDYSHIAGFMQNALHKQIVEFWREVAFSMKAELASRRDELLWLSTAGHVVAWAHVRVDTSPKYYLYEPYKGIKEECKSYKRDYCINEGYYNHGQTMSYIFLLKNKVLTYKEALRRLKTDSTFREIVNSAIEDCQHYAFVMEFIPVTSKTYLNENFEFVCVNRNSQENTRKVVSSRFEEIFQENKGNKIIRWVDPVENATYIVPTVQTQNFVVDGYPSSTSQNEQAKRRRKSTPDDFDKDKTSMANVQSFKKSRNDSMEVEIPKMNQCLQMSEFLRNAPDDDKTLFWITLSDSISDKLYSSPLQYVYVSTNCHTSMIGCAYTIVCNQSKNYIHSLYKKKI